MKIALGADHGGYDLKNKIQKHLEERGFTVVNFGVDGPESVNYPDYAHPVCEAVVSGACTLGILVCGTGIGMSIAANKHKGIRAACCSDTYSARMTRKHNDANVLCLGGRVVGDCLAMDMVDIFVDTAFEGGRHATRVAMLNALDENR